MKNYIVYCKGEEIGIIQAGSHNAAEKKAQKKYPPTEDRIQFYMRVNPTTSREDAIKNLNTAISVAYTEI